MKWIWEHNDWPNYHYDSGKIAELERAFLLSSGYWVGVFSQLNESDRKAINVQLLTDEALHTSEIEAEYLDRDSLQSSIQRQFGIHTDLRKISAKEQGIAELMVDVYQNYEEILSAEKLHYWHNLVMNGRNDLLEKGVYRSRPEAMQIVSGAIHDPKVHYQAPDGASVSRLMNDYVQWFNLELHEKVPFARLAAL